ncbi:MAG: AcrB/AcrD/AcrF family protein, partial [Gammaproteobacteria bacterium]
HIVEKEFQDGEKDSLIKAITVSHNENQDAYEFGPHLATITVDLLTAENRNTKLQDFVDQWRANVGVVPQVQSISYKEPKVGPSGQAIEVRLMGDDLSLLSQASFDLQNWLTGYDGVENIYDDLRPGKPEFSITLKEGALNLGLDSQTIASQMRAAFQGIKVQETNIGLETFEVTVKLANDSRDDYVDFDTFPIIHPQTKAVIPLSSVADITTTRGFSRISRVNNQRTVTVYGDIDVDKNNTKQLLADAEKNWAPIFHKKYPELSYSLEGEIKNAGTTQKSIMKTFVTGLFGVFILLSFQFKSYVEPFIVLVAIPMALMGVIWGHMIMGLQFTMPSMMGFVSLAGIVVNDSILLVEFVKKRVAEGFSIHDAAAKASYDRFRAVLLTSITTIAGMTPLLFESSLQAQILIPLATSIVFGIATSTMLVIFVIPCLYSILEDFGLTTASVIPTSSEEL